MRRCQFGRVQRRAHHVELGSARRPDACPEAVEPERLELGHLKPTRPVPITRQRVAHSSRRRYFSPEVASPSMTLRCITMNAISTGAIASRLAAISTG
ncbi:hypothetical protein GCM10022286_31110 [Gryllotalpicola daejeonensis]|uniref:Uncharacterized protein n=1 Tax=Gryllotalpicola daejeonensis TaxID=993087 RepID=A0ABP7ZPD7_9MICO